MKERDNKRITQRNGVLQKLTTDEIRKGIGYSRTRRFRSEVLKVGGEQW